MIKQGSAIPGFINKHNERKKKKRSYESKKRIIGMGFIFPWFLGFIFFFIKPCIQSFIYSFQKIFVSPTGFTTQPVGLENFRYIFMVDPDFIRKLVESIRMMIFEVPLILVFSIFIAIILNQKFRGRMLARSLFFMPVIIASGIVIELLKQDILAQSISTSATVYIFQSTSVEDIMLQSGLPMQVVNFIVSVINHIFDLTWKSGIQILLFLAALQTIPSSMYEVSAIEGATTWESFWKITVPMISPMILVNIVYTIVDSFTDYRNVTMRKILVAADTFRYELSSAMAWSYFAIVSVILVIVLRYMSKRVFYIVD